ncbi:unnamed protein product [Dicrocoelium dendriticum]|nr:unnamed protein product [Dicrocoelium dendriticum]
MTYKVDLLNSGKSIESNQSDPNRSPSSTSGPDLCDSLTDESKAKETQKSSPSSIIPINQSNGDPSVQVATINNSCSSDDGNLESMSTGGERHNTGSSLLHQNGGFQLHRKKLKPDRQLSLQMETEDQLTKSGSSRNWRVNARVSSDLRRWRLTSADQLHTLIDECERLINGRKLYVCKFCGKVYEIKSSMRYHMKIIHLQMHLRTTEMQCRSCGKQFTCVSAVNRHQAKCLLATCSDSNLNLSRKSVITADHTAFGVRSLSFRTVENNAVCLERDGDALADCAGNFRLENIHDVSLPKSAFRFLSPNSSTMFGPLPNACRGATAYCDVQKSNDLSHDLVESKFDTNANGFEYCSTFLHHQYSQTQKSDAHDPLQNSTKICWPEFLSANSTVSDLNPLQLEMCMKAMVQRLNVKNELNRAQEELICSSESGPEGSTDFHRSETLNDSNPSSFSPGHASTDSFEVGHTFNGASEAIDLSARTPSETIIIKSR